MPDKPSLDEIFGSIESIGQTPPIGQRLLARTKRVGALTTKGLLGDVPFVRKTLPSSIREIEPAYGYEQPIEPITRLGRDIFALKGIGKLGVLRTGLRGVGIGMATAGTEKPEELLQAGALGGVALPSIKKVGQIISPAIESLAKKGLKSSRQAWQDLIRAGYMVEKSSVERAQEKGINYLMNKKSGLRDSDAFLKLGEEIHNKSLDLRRYWGDKVGRFRDLIFRNPKIRVSIENPRQKFIDEITQPGVGVLEGIPTETVDRLNSIKSFLNLSEKEVTPSQAYMIIDKLDDMISESKRGILSLGKNAGRLVANLSRDLKKQIYKSAPRSISEKLRAVEQKFGEIADTTDDVFDRLKFAKQGVSTSERIGATETALKRGLKADIPAEERQVWENLNRLLPKNQQFMEKYKDVFAAQDFSKEGIGFLFRRLLLSPRMAASQIGAVQPLLRTTGKALETGYKIGREITPPILLRKSIAKEEKPTLDEIFK